MTVDNNNHGIHIMLFRNNICEFCCNKLKRCLWSPNIDSIESVKRSCLFSGVILRFCQVRVYTCMNTVIIIVSYYNISIFNIVVLLFFNLDIYNTVGSLLWWENISVHFPFFPMKSMLFYLIMCNYTSFYPGLCSN